MATLAGTPVIFIHGHGSTQQTWKGIIDELPPGRYYPIDLRGHGLAPLGDERDFSISSIAGDIWEMCDRESLDRVMIVAHSMGCRLAVKVAALQPERIVGMMLIDMEMQPRPKQEISEEGLAKLRAFRTSFCSYEEMLTYLSLYDISAEQIQTHIQKGKITKTEDGQYKLLFNLYTNYLAWNCISASNEAEDAFIKVANLDIPMRLLLAEKESSVSPEGLEWMIEKQPKLSIQKIPGSTHKVHKTARRQFLQAFKDLYSSFSSSDVNSSIAS